MAATTFSGRNGKKKKKDKSGSTAEVNFFPFFSSDLCIRLLQLLLLTLQVQNFQNCILLRFDSTRNAASR